MLLKTTHFFNFKRIQLETSTVHSTLKLLYTNFVEWQESVHFLQQLKSNTRVIGNELNIVGWWVFTLNLI